MIGLWLPAAICVAGGLGAVRAGVAGVAIAGGAVRDRRRRRGRRSQVDRDLQRPDWRAVARGARHRAGGAAPAALILIQHYRTLLPLSLYLPHLAFLRAPAAPRVRELDVISMQLAAAAAVLVGRGLQPDPVADAARATRSPASARSGSAASSSSRSCGWLSDRPRDR